MKNLLGFEKWFLLLSILFVVFTFIYISEFDTFNNDLDKNLVGAARYAKVDRRTDQRTEPKITNGILQKPKIISSIDHKTQLNNEIKPTCSDNIKNGGETDIDCGGDCGICAGDYCGTSTECKSNSCYNNLCVIIKDLCKNGQKEDFETDIDCGGICAKKYEQLCTNNNQCKQDGDCSSQFCLPAEKKCAPPEIQSWLDYDYQTSPGPAVNKAVNEIKNEVQITNPQATLKKITKFIQNNVLDSQQLLSSADKGSKTAEDMISNSELLQGCTDFGVAFVAIAREIGYPTIYVDTIELDLHKRLKNGCSSVPPNGHVFVNVYFNGDWRIYNPTQGKFINPVYGVITYCSDHNGYGDTCYIYNCEEDSGVIGPEGCYFYNLDADLEVKTVVITEGKVRKGVSLWDFGVDNRDHANIKLHEEYGVPYQYNYCSS
ncbi:hypothetical protein HOK51_06620 [Candidatus Woesearchaeota archaeon]|jgi:hypothetical protein|nr:hypothetical protein [Candidatus Woesearchaeota archaeon]MBT6519497.1 hypothetical protein [Candidatus Woesearchaeota archaeon]MBT7366936.1 hypothetical protein [Candidatus Woesearchaeota archaeon]